MSLFKPIRVPKILVPKKGREQAQKIARQFAEFIDSATEEYNRTHNASITSEQGIMMMMDNGTSFQKILDDNPDKAAFAKKAIELKWAGEKGFRSGYRWVSPRWAEWWLYNFLNPYRPDLGKAIIEHPKGEQWIAEFVTGFRRLVWGK